ncbi:hypothetical protein DWB77_05348 [Streptomyces hundungensis]|uniref:Uncharacterized protein n=1 Tax=Streptomyces hundungensis TaxID=1077946 RepID=A0A387HPX4_9ACTN|nr:hypothetical protein [Streptomyces hundungensis]AYG83152.1 hypothetical protein DWB77_05348 [Streptomyces hundungensis]
MPRRHASPRDAKPTCDDSTGEVRVPLGVWNVDRLDEDVDLVLSYGEAQRLHAALDVLLDRCARALRRAVPVQ